MGKYEETLKLKVFGIHQNYMLVFLWYTLKSNHINTINISAMGY